MPFMNTAYNNAKNLPNQNFVRPQVSQWNRGRDQNAGVNNIRQSGFNPNKRDGTGKNVDNVEQHPKA